MTTTNIIWKNNFLLSPSHFKTKCRPSPAVKKLILEREKVILCKLTTTKKLLVANTNDGLELDSADGILDDYGHNKEAFDKYFDNKKDAINNSYRIDFNNAAADGVSASKL